jgi:hypothetical protein
MVDKELTPEEKYAQEAIERQNKQVEADKFFQDIIERLRKTKDFIGLTDQQFEDIAEVIKIAFRENLIQLC